MDKEKGGDACDRETEVYSRVVGFYRPIQNWNKGKLAEYKNRKLFELNNKRGVSILELSDLKVGKKYCNDIDDIYLIKYVGKNNIVCEALENKTCKEGEELIYPIDVVLAFHKMYIELKEV